MEKSIFWETLNAWAASNFSSPDVSRWTPDQARQGLVALEQISRSIAATKADLVLQLAAGRDTTATILRETGMSRRAAREHFGAAKTVNDLPGARDLLASGVVSTEHLAHLSHLKPELAAELLDQATGMCADDYKNLVDTHRVRRESKSLAEEQHNREHSCWKTISGGGDRCAIA